jgi:hypothetical protein
MHRTMTGMRLDQIQNPGAGPSPVRIAPGSNITGLEFNNCIFGDTYISKGRLSQHHPAALVLCLSTTLSKSTAEAIDPKCKYCVRILDVARLLEVIDRHLGVKGIARKVDYTTGDDRHTFLKGASHSPQNEFRLGWEGVARDDVWVELPPGIAERVDIS